MWITLAEVPEYIRQAERLLSEFERREVIDHLASCPRAGVLIRDTGGIRKLRWARSGRGCAGDLLLP